MKDREWDGPSATEWRAWIRGELAEMKLAPAREAEIIEELATHLEEVYEDARLGGADEEAARARARSALSSHARELSDAIARAERGAAIFGGVSARRKPSLLGGSPLSRLLPESRYAFRAILRTPVFSLTVVATLAVGIGANTAIFAVVKNVLLDPLPFPNPDRLAMVWAHHPAYDLGFDEIPISPAFFADLRAQSDLEGLAAFKAESFDLSGAGEPERLPGILATAEFFRTLGVIPASGQGFAPEDDYGGRGHVVVLSDGLWRRRFGADPEILGRSLTLNGEPHTVVAIMPRDFDFPRGADLPGSFRLPARPELWVPLVLPDPPRGPSDLAVIARMHEGTHLEGLQAQLDAVSRRFEERYPRYKGAFDTRALPMRDQIVEGARPLLTLLFGAVCLVLLVASVNAANLMVVRSLARRKEVAIRAALGASRARLMEHALNESLLLSGAAGLAGLGLAWTVVWLLRVLAPADLPRISELALDPGVAGFAVLLSLGIGVTFGSAPLWQPRIADLRGALSDGGARVAGALGRRARGALIVAEVALSVVLLVGSGLLVRSLLHLLAVDPGFHSEGVLTGEITLPAASYPDASSITRFHRGALERIRTLPGVEAAAVGKPLPMSGAQEASVFSVETHPSSDGALPVAEYTMVSSGYFRALGVPLLAGREFTDDDDETSPAVAIVSETMTRRFWPGEDPIGRRFKLGPADGRRPWFTVVGVAGDVKRFALSDEPRPEMYVPYLQDPYPSLQTLSLVVRSDLEPRLLEDEIRGEISRLDENVPLASVHTMAELVSQSAARARFATLLVAAFAWISLALAMIGLYGAVAHSVGYRRREIGIRTALGARRRDVGRMIVTEGLVLAVSGAVLGLSGALVLARLLRSQLFGVTPEDPLVYAGAILVAMAVATAACYAPARRAARVDPVTALRSE